MTLSTSILSTWALFGTSRMEVALLVMHLHQGTKQCYHLYAYQANWWLVTASFCASLSVTLPSLKLGKHVSSGGRVHVMAQGWCSEDLRSHFIICWKNSSFYRFKWNYVYSANVSLTQLGWWKTTLFIDSGLDYTMSGAYTCKVTYAAYPTTTVTANLFFQGLHLVN